MDFISYIESLPNLKTDEIEKIAEITCSTKVSVYRWLNGGAKVPPIKKKIIAEHYGKTIEELFPECE